jgi:hypothetical protein
MPFFLPRRPELRRFLAFVVLALFTAAGGPTQAAELRVSKGTVIVEEGAAYVEVDVSWRLSWRNATNWDAAWLFAKLPRTDGGNHLRLAPSGHQTLQNRHPDQPDAAFTVPNDSLGAFVYRDVRTESRGPNDWTLRLRLALPGDRTPADLPETVRVYGVEMVYVPEEPLFLGDPQQPDEAPAYAFYEQTADTTSSPAYRVTSSGAIPVCSGSGSLCYRAEGGPPWAGDQEGPIPASYPNGYDAFYLMKYEVTQGQYAAFLNALTGLQSAERDVRGGRTYAEGRGTISLVNGTYVTNRPDRACNYLSWESAAAYADWAGLRPMTELEYEKAARGPAEPVPDEFAWGTTTIAHGDTIFAADSSVAAVEDGTEVVRGNADYGAGSDRFVGGDRGYGPLRVDIFETHAHRTGADSLRQASGAGYYGAHGLTGSLFDRVVTAGDSVGRAFRGTHGDGQISYPGQATNDDWPTTQGEGLGLRGGSLAHQARWSHLAVRIFGDYSAHYGATAMVFRAARTAP